MSLIHLRWEGRFGNNCLQYLHARAYAEQHSCELRTPPWIGQKIFAISEREPETSLPCVLDTDLQDRVDIEIDGYALHQGAMRYTKEQAQSWLRFRPEAEEVLRAMKPCNDHLWHLRRVDYYHMDYIVVSEQSYRVASRLFGYDPAQFGIIVEETASSRKQPFPEELSFLPDFWRLVQAKVLFRSNSTFPWVAALLGNAEHIYSPNLTGFIAPSREGKIGEERLVPFAEGNWPAISSYHDGCTDLHVKGQP